MTVSIWSDLGLIISRPYGWVLAVMPIMLFLLSVVWVADRILDWADAALEAHKRRQLLKQTHCVPRAPGLRKGRR